LRGTNTPANYKKSQIMNMISFVRKAQIYSGIDIKQLGSQLFGFFT